MPRPHQRRAVAAAAVAPAIFTDSHGVDWALVQQEDGLTLATPKPGYHRLQGAQGWRRLLGFWGDWHLYKAEAVRSSGSYGGTSVLDSTQCLSQVTLHPDMCCPHHTGSCACYLQHHQHFTVPTLKFCGVTGLRCAT